MIALTDKTLKSQRLTYRLLCETDLLVLYDILKDPTVTINAGFKPPENLEEFKIFFESLTRYNTAIAILKEDTLIGYIHVNKYTPDDPIYNGKKCVGLGFVIGKQYHNQGYATETLITITAYLKGIFDFCFADHFEDNKPSMRVIEKSGYKFAEKYSMYFDCLEKDVTCYSHVY